MIESDHVSECMPLIKKKLQMAAIKKMKPHELTNAQDTVILYRGKINQDIGSVYIGFP